MDDIEVTDRRGKKTKYQGTYNPNRRTIKKAWGGEVHLRENDRVETTPSPAAFVIVVIVLIALASQCVA
jgi:hypothetical protein